jgi:hypothetical protein
MSEREFWLILRRAILMIADAIQRRFGLDEPKPES